MHNARENDNFVKKIESALKFIDAKDIEYLILDNGSNFKIGKWLESISTKFKNIRTIHIDHSIGEAEAKNIFDWKTIISTDKFLEMDDSIYNFILFYIIISDKWTIIHILCCTNVRILPDTNKIY